MLAKVLVQPAQVLARRRFRGGGAAQHALQDVQAPLPLVVVVVVAAVVVVAVVVALQKQRHVGVLFRKER